MAFFTDPADRIEQLINRLERSIRLRFLAQLTVITDQNTLLEIRRKIVEGNIAGAVLDVELAAEGIGKAVTQAYVVAGDEAAKFIAGKLQAVVDFDQVNVRAVQAMQTNQLRLVQGFTAQQTQATRLALLDGIERGANPRDIARQVKGSIGLTPKQVQYVNNYRRALETGDRNALTRALRDRRFDRTVERAIRGEASLSKAQIDNMVGRYETRWRAYRAEVISRTEALRSAHEGTREMYRQAGERGIINLRTLIRTWFPANDDRVRDNHEVMRGQQVTGVDEPFVSGLGNMLMFPGDASAPPEDTAQCRCAITTRFEAAPRGILVAA